MPTTPPEKFFKANWIWLVCTLVALILTRVILRIAYPDKALVVRVPNEIIVASWNIGFDPVEKRIDEIVAGAREINADILVLIEVTPSSASEVLRREFQRAGMNYKVSVAQQRDRQSICVFYRNSIEISQVKPLKATDLGNPDLRQAYTATIKAGSFDFNFIAIHNKSKRQSETGDSTEMRNRQLNILRDFIRSATKGSEKDAILIGDFNMLPDEDKDQFDRLNKFGNLMFIAQPSEKSPFTFIARNGQDTSFIDGIAITKDVKEYVPGSFATVPLYELSGRGKLWFREKVSDHIPVMARFKTDGPDDD
jgi:endonuclease/exonuclease/phosphatase family metal-dependent hydrolase